MRLETERSSSLKQQSTRLGRGAALFPRISRWDAQYMNAALAAVQIPLMVIQSAYMGAKLRRESLQAAQCSPWLDRVRKYAPNANVEIVFGAGHFVHMEMAEQVNALLQNFLAKTKANLPMMPPKAAEAASRLLKN
jgi:pimeloyl-ACP methyl ester carboxylesterase